MQAFVDLYNALDSTTSSRNKLAALTAYFRSVPPQDGAWAVYFLAGGKPRQIVPVKLLKQFAREAAGIPEWLFDESYQAVGDLAETIALLLPESTEREPRGLATWMDDVLLPLRGLAPDQLQARLFDLWSRLDARGRLVGTKLITGSFRVGVSRLLVTRALAQVSGLDPKRIAQRLVGYTDLSARPDAAMFQALIAGESEGEQVRQHSGQPYPFFLAHPLQASADAFPALLGEPSNWLIEWKWDGIRAQIVKRAGQTWVWSRGEDLVTDRFPELVSVGDGLPDGTVLDGEVVVWKDGKVMPFAILQQRIGRKTVGPKILRDAPVSLLAYDLLEWHGEDQRTVPQRQRRERLEQVVQEHPHPHLHISPRITGADWADLATQREASRAMGVEGMMLKASDAAYGVGRTKDVGVWWKWKIDPFTIDAVLIYAQRGHGRRASLYTDYTFAVWQGEAGAPNRSLVPFAKAYSGLTDEEIRKVDNIIRKTTVETFGPVRSVKPTLVFELGFEGISRSPRHKSGIAVRFPRMLRWRLDKPVDEADTLATLEALLPA